MKVIGLQLQPVEKGKFQPEKDNFDLKMTDDRSDVEIEPNIDNDIDDEEQRTSKTTEISPAEPQLNDKMLEILKQNNKYLHRLFDWLSLKDLCALRQTCKQFKSVVDWYVDQNYPLLRIGCRKIDVFYGEVDDYGRLDDVSKSVIKRYHLWTDFPVPSPGTKALLHHVESVKIHGGHMKYEFYETFLQFCPNLKHMFLWNCHLNRIMGKSNEWLLRSYPQLEHFELQDLNDYPCGYLQEITELKTFFELNPNIRTFSTIAYVLNENRNWLKSSNIQVDTLNLKCVLYLGRYANGYWELINELYEQGFHKRLNIYGWFNGSDKELVGDDKMIPLRSIDKIHLENEFNEVIIEHLANLLPTMITLKEISFISFERNDSSSSPDSNKFAQYFSTAVQMVSGLFFATEFDKQLNILASRLTNVQRIHVRQAKLTDILPFIQRSPKIKEIRIDQLLDDGHFYKNGIVDLMALNRLRKQLAHASKITLYIEEDALLANKWAAMDTMSQLIDLKRKYEWPHRTHRKFEDY